MNAAIGELQAPFLDGRQIAASRAIMGLDTQLVEDGTYFVVESNGELAGCGGWSRRSTLYGGDRTPGRSPALSIRKPMQRGSGRCTHIRVMRGRASAA